MKLVSGVLLLCVTALAAVDIAEASHPGLSPADRRMSFDYTYITKGDKRTEFTYGCRDGDSCYDGKACMYAVELLQLPMQEDSFQASTLWNASKMLLIYLGCIIE